MKLMKRFVALLSFACVVACDVPAARAQAGAPVPTKRRIVLHGIECLPNVICPETQPVLDEAVQILQEEPSRPIVVRPANAAEQVPSAGVVLDYFAAGDTGAERVQLDGFSE
jgi:hypothetical protein